MIDIDKNLVLKKVDKVYCVFLIRPQELLQQGEDLHHAKALFRKYRASGAVTPQHYTYKDLLEYYR